MLIWS